jgi:calmodulin
MSEISDDKVTILKELFDLYDTDKDGCINTIELGDVMKALGVDQTQDELQEMVNEVDSNNKGKIEFKEFLQLFARKLKGNKSEDELMEAFKLYDKDGNGSVSAAEFRHVMTTMGEKLTEEEVEEMIINADMNGDGIINYHEFINLKMTK